MVVGDLHGCIDDLMTLLARANFNPECDRVFCTGDLVDRGPDSLACLALLREHWFRAAMGNHELAFVSSIRDLMSVGVEGVSADPDVLARYLNGNNMGAGWLAHAYLETPDPAYWEDVISLVEAMPNLIVTGEGDSRFHVVHGAAMIGGNILEDRVIDAIQMAVGDGRFSKEECSAMAYDLAWERAIARLIHGQLPHEKMHPGLSITYCGHNIVAEPAMALSHYHIDTGSGQQQRLGRRRAGLTLVVTENGFPVTTLTTKEHETHDSCHC